MIFFNILSS
ncbi:hypothetical protein CGLO_12260 [Colletotrichum gloeosporioides Cg-14]|uniref:Uncharacterized protein n=1 Tax=Colletotrichum gloeosporioides (strain Cg-14) TaxID=1237896 RepID=T0K6A7_COLGC|nr:hypothetical protein CGLO_12260 [Colletotrichum gloeosporioides Cg-14]